MQAGRAAVAPSGVAARTRVRAATVALTVPTCVIVVLSILCAAFAPRG